MDINHISTFLREDGDGVFSYQRDGNYHWLWMKSTKSGECLSFHLPDHPVTRRAVLLRMKSTFNEAVDEALKAEDLAGLDAEVAEPELVGSTG